jgi:DNA invertase Pin-like site-specific DNA recombinase
MAERNDMTASNGPELVPCAIYIRVSTDEQAKEEHYSLSAQEDYCMAEIRRRADEGWFHLITISDPGYSGGTFDRPGLLELIGLVKAKKLGAILVYKRERLFRNAELAAQVQAVFDLHSVKILSCVEGLHDSTPHAVFMRQLIDANAQFERANGRNDNTTASAMQPPRALGRAASLHWVIRTSGPPARCKLRTQRHLSCGKPLKK